jgi:hypothetical protein
MAGQSFPSSNGDGDCCNDVVAKEKKNKKKSKKLKRKGKSRALRE